MTDRPRSEKAIFLAALDRSVPQERAAFLDSACGDDSELHAQVAALLAAHEQLGSLPASPTPPETRAGGTVADEPTCERLGSYIGPYKLLQQIGEGGMGAVFLAEQSHPVQRTVALKLIKAGNDDKQIIARFEAERQALALMDHPNIARVLDAGTTESGRPFFVMELVKGVPITRYCDEHRLTPRQRLELMVPVCQAVQHAHQKGIIHRDLKPSNILVGLCDGKPAPKIIDFGVAKATGQKLTNRTLFTGFGAVVGTLEYMSPEQAEPNQLDIDTRSDIYSLGVVLYELLTGTTPLERRRLKEAAILEVLRLIREEEPPRPSTRLSSTDELAKIAASRGTEPRKLSGLVRGELDWIVMKALEKERGRRYETANGLGMDIQRYLRDEPVQACPPSAGYRLRKFVRRYKGAVLAVSLVVLALIGGTVGATWGLVRAKDAEKRAIEAGEEKDRARAAAVTETEQKEQAARFAADQRDLALAALEKLVYEAMELLDASDAEEEPEVNSLKIALRRELLATARKGLVQVAGSAAEAPAFDRRVAALHQRVGELFRLIGDYPEAAKQYSQGLARIEAFLASHPDDPQARRDRARTWTGLAYCLEIPATMKRVVSAEAEAELARAEKLAVAWVEAESQNADARRNLAQVYCIHGRRAVKGRLYQQDFLLRALEEVRKVLAGNEATVSDREVLMGIHGELAQTFESIARTSGDNRELASARYHFRERLKLEEEKSQRLLEARESSDRARLLRFARVRALAYMYLAEADLSLGLNEPREARAAVARAIEKLEPLAWTSPPTPTGPAVVLYQAQLRAVEIDAELKEIASAREWLARAAATVNRVKAHSKATGSKMPFGVKGGQLRLAGAALLVGGEAEARKYLRQDLAALEAVRAEHLDRNVVAAYGLVARGYLEDLGDRWAAMECLARADAAYEKLAARDNDPKAPKRLSPQQTQPFSHIPLMYTSNPNLAQLKSHRDQVRTALAREATRPSLENRVNVASHSYYLATSLVYAPARLLETPDEALTMARQAVQRCPQVAGYWQALGVVHLQAGQWNEARAALEKAVELRGQEDGVNLLALALVQHRLGEVETAKKYRERFLKWVQENAKHPFMGSDPLLRRLAPQVSLALGQPIQLPRPGPNPFPGKPIIPRPPMPPGGTTVPK